MPAEPDRLHRFEEPVDGSVCLAHALRRVGLVNAASLVPHHAAEHEPLDRSGLLRQRRCLLRQADTAPAHPDVHVDQKPDTRSGRHGRRCEVARVADVVDHNGELAGPSELGGGRVLSDAHDLVGDQDALDAAARHRRRFGQGRCRHSDRAVLDLKPRVLHRLVRFRVRPERDPAPGPDRRPHEVPSHRFEIDDERGRRQLVDRQTDERPLPLGEPHVNSGEHAGRCPSYVPRTRRTLPRGHPRHGEGDVIPERPRR